LIQFDSPDDEHWVARNKQRREISKHIEKSKSSCLLTRIMKRSYTHITTDDKNSLCNKSFASKYSKLKIIQINQINVKSSLKN
jgi:hypothetical protein